MRRSLWYWRRKAWKKVDAVRLRRQPLAGWRMHLCARRSSGLRRHCERHCELQQPLAGRRMHCGARRMLDARRKLGARRMQCARRGARQRSGSRQFACTLKTLRLILTTSSAPAAASTPRGRSSTRARLRSSRKITEEPGRSSSATTMARGSPSASTATRSACGI
ncbi:hypothetical protein T492DRAFT_1009738 [Pavlovales sp. CCMP2436]|nr:hypothetical protein T492DRAFT_1009738 [Pavlovales sp. CCMP2436]